MFYDFMSYLENEGKRKIYVQTNNFFKFILKVNIILKIFRNKQKPKMAMLDVRRSVVHGKIFLDFIHFIVSNKMSHISPLKMRH